MSTRPPLPRSFIDQHRRERIMRATATLVADRGHAAVTVADIVKQAGIARNTFYETFGSKNDAIEATTAWAFEQAVTKVTEAIDPADPLEVRIDLALTAIVGFLTAEPALARTALVDAYAVAPPLHDEAMTRFAGLTGLASPFDEMLVGGVRAILYRHICEGTAPDDMAALLPELRDFVLAPFGPEAVPA